MASTSAVSLLQSIQEGLAKLTAEVDNMESKIVVGSNEEYSTDEDATTVVSLSESECGSMGSFEKFVHCSLPPPAVLDPIQRSRIPFKMQPKEEKTARKTSRIPISVEKHNKVKTVPLSLDAPLDVPLNASWKIGVENCTSGVSPKASKIAQTALQTAPVETMTPAVSLNEKFSITPRFFKSYSKIPGAPREAAGSKEEGMVVNRAHYLQGQSRLPRVPQMHTAF